MKLKKFLLIFLASALTIVGGTPGVSPVGAFFNRSVDQGFQALRPSANQDSSLLPEGRQTELETKFREVEGGIPNQYIVVFDAERLASDAGIPLLEFNRGEQNEDLLKQSKERMAKVVEAKADHLARIHYATIGYTYTHTIRGFSAEMSEAEAKALSQNPDVRYVEQDSMLSVQESQNNPPWGLDRIDQRSFPLNKTYNYTSSGAGVNVYVLDTGIRTTHREFGGRASIALDLVGGLGINGDCVGHGTHIAATIGGATYGVAKNVTLHSVRVINCNGVDELRGKNSLMLKGVDWVTANHVKPAVVNMSVGRLICDERFNPPCDRSLNDAVRESIRAGITYVISAGNDNRNANEFSPASVYEAIVVGATDSGDRRWANSNFGDVLDVFAPGVSILSAGHTSDTAGATKTGTSMAAPHVTGVVALYLERYPTATPEEIEHMIVHNATNDKIIDVGMAPNGLLHTPANLYQRHADGRIWQYNEPAIGGWEEIDNNPATAAIAADGGNLYQLHNNGLIWKYTGPPLTGWKRLDNNPATVAIAADGKNLYQLRNNGSILKYTGASAREWQEVGNNPATLSIAASGGNLYQLRNNGSILKYTGTPISGWQEVGKNSAAIAVVADGKTLYQLHDNGSIWKYLGRPLQWEEIDNNPATVAIVADEGNLYQLHNDGLIWRYTGPPLTGWQLIDNNSNTRAIVAGEGNLYQLHNDGLIWRYTGPPLTGWQLIDTNPATVAIAAD